MAWYYRDGEQEIGPVEKDQMQKLVKDGSITATTFIRSDSSADWKTLGQMRAESARKKQEAEQTAVSGGPRVYCSECGGVFSKDDVITYKDLHVCASCKPLFFQKLKEGVVLPTTFEYGGFWIRFVAKFLDGLLLYVVGTVLAFFFGIFIALAGESGSPEGPNVVALVGIIFMQLLQFAIRAAYDTFFIGKYAATPGKMALGLKVITSEGDRVSYARALGRHFAEMLSALILLIGYIMAAFDAEKRALHDHICNTRVVKK